MARSLDKAAWSGHAPLCALCLTPRAERRSQVHLAHGIAVWLCPAHGSDEFLRRRAGRDFVHTLGEVRRAAGVLTRRRERALAAHLQRVRRSRTSRPRPGSYAWPRLRREVEARAARGERPRAIIAPARAPAGPGGRPRGPERPHRLPLARRGTLAGPTGTGAPTGATWPAQAPERVSGATAPGRNEPGRRGSAPGPRA